MRVCYGFSVITLDVTDSVETFDRLQLYHLQVHNKIKLSTLQNEVSATATLIWEMWFIVANYLENPGNWTILPWQNPGNIRRSLITRYSRQRQCDTFSVRALQVYLLSYPFRTDFMDLNLYWIKGALFVCFSFWLRVL